jgi:hypothetical protein
LAAFWQLLAALGSFRQLLARSLPMACQYPAKSCQKQR